ncbi:response regulator [uncultured Maribacter sp.]|uniref:response regulator n=1 Tax=uncultured Maribacter sp. TaxID=431308 RepID=UPI00261D7F4D|nr:response regulator [uncultured Maribacter sp.]
MTSSNFTHLKSILLIDDDESSNFLNTIFINKLDLDIDVHATLNGQEGLDFIMNNGDFEGDDVLSTPCMIMLDINMPLMNGWQFMEKYEELVPKSLKEQIFIVLVTISDSIEDKRKAKENPYINEFIQKPLSDIKFKKLINKHFKEVIV